MWGAMGGALVALIPAAMVGLGLATPGVSVWQLTLGLMGPFAVGGAAAAAGTLLLARRADEPDLLDGTLDVDQVGLSEQEKRDLLRSRR
jgi:hypothetical protein